MFRGSHPTRIDEKSRLKLPADCKRYLDENYGRFFYITSRDGKRAEIWPLQEWQKIEEKLEQIPNSIPAKKKLMDRINYYGQVQEIDAQGRLLMPQILRESAKLDGETVVFGMGKHLEVVNHGDFKQDLESKPWTEEDDQKISEFGL
jgi:MraZ protein